MTVGATPVGLLSLLFAYFVAFSITLTMLPFASAQAGMPDGAIGAVLALLGTVDLIMDPIAGLLANQFSRRAVVRAGSLIGVAGSLVLATTSSPLTVVFFALAAGVATSCIVNPTLSALSEWRSEQIRVQGSNAAVQRLGSLFSAASLALLLTADQVIYLQLITAAGYATTCWCARSIPSNSSRSRSLSDRATLRVAYKNSYTAIFRHPAVAQGALVNSSLAVFFVVGASFYPLFVLAQGGSALLVGITLGSRDVVAAVAFRPLRGAVRRWGMRRSWMFAATVGLVALGASALTASTIISALLFSIHGLAIGFGIAIANMHVTQETTSEQRVFAFAAVSIASRVVNIVVPLTLGAIMAVGSARLPILSGVAIGVILLLLYTVADRRRTRRTSA